MLRQVIRRAVLGAILGGVGTALYVLLPSVLGGSGAGLGPAFRAGIGGAVIGFLIESHHCGKCRGFVVWLFDGSPH